MEPEKSQILHQTAINPNSKANVNSVRETHEWLVANGHEGKKAMSILTGCKGKKSFMNHEPHEPHEK
jgi:hypothetical protein